MSTCLHQTAVMTKNGQTANTEAWYDEEDEELYEEWVRQYCEKAFENGNRRY